MAVQAFTNVTSKQDFDAYSSRIIKKLKRRSDGWSSAGGIVRSKSISSMLKQRQQEATLKHKDVEILLTEASAQLQIQQQACSVLKYIRQGDLLEEVEAERLILLSGERYKLYKHKAEAIVCDFQPSVNEERVQSPYATLYISDLKLALNEEFIHQLQKSSDCSAYHFLCLLKESKTLGSVATQVVTLSPLTADRMVGFSNRLTIPEVSGDFELDVEIYHMVCHLNRKRISLNMHNRKLVKKCIRNLTCTASSETIEMGNTDLCTSQFQLLGNVHISKETLHNDKHLIETSANVVDFVQLSITADPDVSHLLTTDNPIKGYLSVFRAGSWRREWFVLTGTYLYSWTYPDQPDKMEKPRTQCDLGMCSQPAFAAESDVCAWQNSFLLPLPSDRLLLAAETPSELEQWMSALNAIIIICAAWEAGSTDDQASIDH